MTAARTQAEKQLRAFIAKFEPELQASIRAVRRSLRRRFPAAHELVYENYNFFVIGHGATERPPDCIFSIAASSKGISLCFMQGAALPDLVKILLGSGKQTRFVRLESAEALHRPGIEKLPDVAVARSKAPMASGGRGQLIVRSVSAQQRPRRKTT